MSLLSFLKRLFGGRSASALYKRGLAKAHRDDWVGAIEDYTVAIRSPKASSETRAMAHFNRALAYAHQGNYDRADADLRVVLDMPNAPVNVQAWAKDKLTRWGKRRK